MYLHPLIVSLNKLTATFRAFNFAEFLNGKAQQPVPKSLASYEGELNDIANRCHVMCMNILELLAVGLKVRKSHRPPTAAKPPKVQALRRAPAPRPSPTSRWVGSS